MPVMSTGDASMNATPSVVMSRNFEHRANLRKPHINPRRTHRARKQAISDRVVGDVDAQTHRMHSIGR